MIYVKELLNEVKNTDYIKDKFSHITELSRNDVIKLVKKYKYYYNKGKYNTYRIAKFIYYSFSSFYIGEYLVKFTRLTKSYKIPHFLNTYESIVEKSLKLHRLLISFSANKKDIDYYCKKEFSSSKFLNTQIDEIRLELFRISQKCILSRGCNYAIILNKIGRIIPSIHVCTKLLDYVDDHQNMLLQENTTLNFHENIIYVLIYNIEEYTIFSDDFLYRQNILKMLIYYSKLLLNDNKKLTHKKLDHYIIMPNNKCKMLIGFVRRFSNKSINNTHYLNIMNISLDDKFGKWILKNNLALNPFNDLSTNNIINDSIIFFSYQINNLFTLFKGISTEYITARYLYFLAVTHLNYNMCYMKVAFKEFYSIFDKIAFLLSKYLNVDFIKLQSKKFQENMKKHNKNYIKLSFTKLFSKGKYRKAIDKYYYGNKALKGLLWISKDLQSPQDGLDNKMFYARQLRNAMEHRYLYITDNIKNIKYNTDSFNKYDGTISVNTVVFKDIVKHLMYVSRESIILLSFCINIGENDIGMLTCREMKYMS